MDEDAWKMGEAAKSFFSFLLGWSQPRGSDTGVVVQQPLVQTVILGGRATVFTVTVTFIFLFRYEFHAVGYAPAMN